MIVALNNKSNLDKNAYVDYLIKENYNKCV